MPATRRILYTKYKARQASPSASGYLGFSADRGLSAACGLPGGRLDERDHERVRLRRGRAALRLEEGPDEERVCRDLEDSRVAAIAESGELQTVLFEELVVVGVQLEIAEVLFVNAVGLEDLARAGILSDVHALRGTREFRPAFRAIGHRTRHRVDQEFLRIRVRRIFAVLQVGSSQDVVRELEQRVL